MKTIDNYVFDGCSSPKSITTPLIQDDYPDAYLSRYFGSSDNLKTLETVHIINTHDICSSAFAGCCNVNDLTLDDSVYSIQNSAFNGCRSIEKIVIPDSVHEIGENLFYDCQNLIESGRIQMGIESYGL